MDIVQSELHYDIWHIIIKFLDKRNLKSVSSVSRQLRLLVLPKLFKSISLRLGVLEDDDTEYERERAEMSMRVLRKMEDPNFDGSDFDFAHLVRNLEIIWVCKNRWFCDEADHIGNALKRLVNLRHFAWSGFRLPIEIARSIPQDAVLKSFRLESVSEVFAHDPGTLGFIQSAETVRDCETFVRSLATKRYEYAAFWHVLRQNQSYLKKISVGSYVMRKLYQYLTGISANLTHLALNEVGHSPGFQMLLREASALEDLTLLGVRSLGCLPCAPHALSRLRFLKVWVERADPIDDDSDDSDDGNDDESENAVDMRAIANDLLTFTRFHRTLSGFDFCCLTYTEDMGDDDDTEENSIWFSDIVEAVHGLESVRVLGISLPNLAEEDMHESLRRITGNVRLKQSCIALRLGGISDVPMEVWTTEFRNCSFISLSSGRPEENAFVTHPTPTIEDLVLLHSGCPLEQFGLDGEVYDIAPYHPPNGTGVIVSPWSATRANWRTERDFCSYEAYWLMKYRTIKEGYEAAPGGFA